LLNKFVICCIAAKFNLLKVQPTWVIADVLQPLGFYNITGSEPREMNFMASLWIGKDEGWIETKLSTARERFELMPAGISSARAVAEGFLHYMWMENSMVTLRYVPCVKNFFKTSLQMF
jgi:hypothetical protein